MSIINIDKSIETLYSIIMSFTQVNITKLAQKQLAKAPLHIRQSFVAWAESVERVGLVESRLTTGRHDEPLSGRRQGQRSVRLNKQWRAIYEVSATGQIILVEVKEVTPHDYRIR